MLSRKPAMSVRYFCSEDSVERSLDTPDGSVLGIMICHCCYAIVHEVVVLYSEWTVDGSEDG